MNKVVFVVVTFVAGLSLIASAQDVSTSNEPGKVTNKKIDGDKGTTYPNGRKTFDIHKVNTTNRVREAAKINDKPRSQVNWKHTYSDPRTWGIAESAYAVATHHVYRDYYSLDLPPELATRDYVAQVREQYKNGNECVAKVFDDEQHQTELNIGNKMRTITLTIVNPPHARTDEQVEINRITVTYDNPDEPALVIECD